jgi:hypothetical protein
MTVFLFPPLSSPQQHGLVRSLVEAAVARVFGASALQIRSPKRGGARIAFARHVAIYLSHVAFGLNYTDTGRVFGRDRTTVRYACAAIEDRRDDMRFDTLLNVLEAALIESVHGILACGSEQALPLQGNKNGGGI